MNTKPPFYMRLIILLCKFFIVCYLKTLRLTLSLSYDKSILEKGAIYAIWHDSLFILPRLIPFYCQKHISTYIMISKSRDGNFPSMLAESFSGLEVIRVGHKTKASALKTGIDLLMKGHSLLLTPDGPRGPRRKIKEGVTTASKFSQKPILPIAIRYSRAITLSSWDKFQIPLPFSRVEVTMGPLLHQNTTQECTTVDLIQQLEDALNGKHQVSSD